MSLQASTGLRNGLLAKLKLQLDGGLIKVFGGVKPASSDAAIGAATLLTTFSVGGTGTGLTLDAAAVNGVLSKSAEVWKGTNVASGVATFYRHVGPGDDGTLSSTAPRVQGNVAVSGSDLNLTAGTTLTAGVETPCDTYTIELPAGG